MKSPPQGTLLKYRSNGDKLFYHPETNTFAAQTKNGIPKTIFKPKNKMEYWKKQ